MVTWDNISGIQKEIAELSQELSLLREDFSALYAENVEIKRIVKIFYERLAKNEIK